MTHTLKNNLVVPFLFLATLLLASPLSASAAVTKMSCVDDIVSASISTTTTTFKTNKPSLKGTACDIKKVYVSIRKAGSTGKALSQKTVTVRNDSWKTKFSKKLTDGDYVVTVSKSKTGTRSILATSTITVGTSKTSTGKAVFAVSPIRLLSGGVTRAGATIPVAYLQITNLGKSAATISGFYLEQTGKASANVVSLLTTVDNKGGSKGTSALNPFKNGKALVPTNATFAAGEMRLFTIKATLSNTVVGNIGKDLKIDVTSLDVSTTKSNTFPIKGTAWVIQ